MKKSTFITWLACETCIVGLLLFLAYSAISTDAEQNKVIVQQSNDIAELQLQNLRLMDGTTFLAEKMTNVIDVIQQKAEWDKLVAEKIREIEGFQRTAALLLMGYETNKSEIIP